MGLVEAIFGNYSKKELKRIEPIKNQVLELEEKYQAMSDKELRQQTQIMKDKISDGLGTLDDVLPDALAVCREAAWRVLGKKPFPVQIIGAIVLHQGRIAEMKTGEGKTLVACLAAYANSLDGQGVHVVTVNDYLAKFQSEEMGKVFRFLGQTIGVVLNGMDNATKRQAYNCDITYGTNSEFGFDYLRDNMVIYKKDKVQRDFSFAIVDEVDSILIDEARTPLIISGQGDKSTELYTLADRFAKTLKPVTVVEMDDKADNDALGGDYIIDEKAKTATLTKSGVSKAERAFNVENLMDADNMTLLHHINQAIKANGVMHKDVDYVVKPGKSGGDEVFIVDEFTGRIMDGRRFNDGLHQAIEAKEGVKVMRESKTIATITYQNYFRLYKKLSGMTGTALTEEDEFREIYKLDCIEVPTNKPVIRKDHPDVVYKTEKGKFNAVIEQIIECHEKGQPVLVGTVSIEKSEYLSRLLKNKGVKHEVLNAKYHEKEAKIVAQAGKFGAVTIATNMAGRGTDIKLTPEVKEAGGLAIIGTERHESRRVDRQLRGRSGRQGDPGSSQFYVSLEDNLMRMFGSERIAGIMDRMGLQEGEVIQHPMITKQIEKAQKKVEENHFGVRKHLLEYDDVMNSQREVIYKKRRHALFGERLSIDINNMMMDFGEKLIEEYQDAKDYEGFKMELLSSMGIDAPFSEEEFDRLKTKELAEKLFNAALEHYKEKARIIGEKTLPVIKNVYENQTHFENIAIPITDGKRGMNVIVNLKKAVENGAREVNLCIEKSITLGLIDNAWKEHLRELDDLKESVQNATYEQKDPLVIYKLESFNLFKAMVEKINEDVISFLMRADIPTQDPNTVRESRGPQGIDKSKIREQRQDLLAQSHSDTQQKQVTQPIRKEVKVGRNDPCPCGSGKKYKQCHGRFENAME